MENLFDTSKLIHDKAIKKLIKGLKDETIKKIVDAGSGKTSASIMLKYFPKARVDAIIYPGDNRKKNPLENAIGSDRLDVIEADICKNVFPKEYDLCLVLLTLGEAKLFGNSFEDLFHHIMDINARFFIIYDIWDDPSVHFRYMEHFFKEKGFKILKRKKFKNPNPEHYPKAFVDKYKLEFDSKHFIGYLVEKISDR